MTRSFHFETWCKTLFHATESTDRSGTVSEKLQRLEIGFRESDRQSSPVSNGRPAFREGPRNEDYRSAHSFLRKSTGKDERFCVQTVVLT